MPYSFCSSLDVNSEGVQADVGPCMYSVWFVPQSIPLLLLYWTRAERDNLLHQMGTVYPNVITYSQIYNMICQRKLEEQRWKLDELASDDQSVIDMEDDLLSVEEAANDWKAKTSFALTVFCEHYRSVVDYAFVSVIICVLDQVVICPALFIV